MTTFICHSTKEQVSATDESNIKLLKAFGFEEGHDDSYDQKSFLKGFHDMPRIAVTAFFAGTYSHTVQHRHRTFDNDKMTAKDWIKHAKSLTRTVDMLRNAPNGWLDSDTAMNAERSVAALYDRGLPFSDGDVKAYCLAN